MTKNEQKITAHTSECELADYLSGSLSAEDRARIEKHIACCDECLKSMVSAHESVRRHTGGHTPEKQKRNIMKKINLYLLFAVLSFLLSFIIPRYFLQLLVATLVLGAKWIIDSKTTKMLVMIYEAWKKGGETEVGRVFRSIDSDITNRL